MSSPARPDSKKRQRASGKAVKLLATAAVAAVAPVAAVDAEKKKKQEKAPVSRTRQAGLTFPVTRVDRHIRLRKYTPRTTNTAPVYLAAVLETILTEIISAAAAVARDNKRSRITPLHIGKGVRQEAALNLLIGDSIHQDGSVLPPVPARLAAYTKE